MTRKTKAQLMAEQAAEQAAYQAQLAAEQAARQAELLAAEEAQYPFLLVNMLERATKLGYELTVKDSMFKVRDYHDGRNANWHLNPIYTKDAQCELDTLVWYVEEEELGKLAEQAKVQAKATALSKLTKEEKELLGL